MSESTKEGVTWFSWTLFIVLALTWGSSFILMKRGLLTFSPVQVGMLRVTLAGGFLLLTSFKRLSALTRKNALPLAVVGIISVFIPYILFPMAVTKIDSGLVGILNSLVPLFTLLIGVIWFRTTVTWRSVLGIGLGLAGAVWLLIPGVEIEVAFVLFGVLPIVAGVGYAIGVNTVNRYLKEMHPLEVTTCSLAFAMGPALVVLFVTDTVGVMMASPIGWQSLGYIAILGIAGTSMANYAFNHLIRTTGSLFSSSVTYAIPVVALFWGFLDGEVIGWVEFAGMLMILTGVWLVNTRKRALLTTKQALEPEAVSNTRSKT
ncbi:MAG: DMT family transporter [Rhodothermaeota bacterium MED-G64]|nr:MAG: DMT family transporter [Rhodothermaeota bacterium MED-G64]